MVIERGKEYKVTFFVTRELLCQMLGVRGAAMTGECRPLNGGRSEPVIVWPAAYGLGIVPGSGRISITGVLQDEDARSLYRQCVRIDLDGIRQTDAIVGDLVVIDDPFRVKD